MKKSIIRSAAIGMVALLTFAGCGGDNNKKSAARQEEDVADASLEQYLVNQPVPQFAYSQLRQTLIDILTIQAETTATTSFFFNQGVVDPVHTCPSIGMPIATTAQLTSPDQIEGNREGGYVTSAQMEQTGIYTGDSTGTYVVCVTPGPEGDGYAFYWEGFVSSVTGPAVWNVDKHQVELIGTPTAEVSTGE